MRSIVKNSISTLFSILLSGLFLYLAFRGKDIGLLWRSLIEVSWGWFVLLFVGSALSHVLRAWRWKYLLYPIKQDVSLRNSFSVIMIGYLINNVVPRLGEFVRPYSMKRLEGISRSATMGTIVLERILDLVTFAMFVLTVFALYSNQFVIWFPSMANFEWLFVAGAAVMMVVFILMFLKAEMMLQFAKRFLGLLPAKMRITAEKIFDSFITGFQASKYPGNYFMIAVTSILIWLSYIVLLYVPFFIYDFSRIPEINFGAAAVLNVASGFAFALPTPSGIGSYHAFTLFALTEMFKVDPAEALSYAVYTHAVGFLTTTILGLYFFIVDKMHVGDVVAPSDTDENRS
ncbi:MAG: lysylphosphatidylglycerol synthase transmembrane domain-containing protein [Bacteroidota bacterium]